MLNFRCVCAFNHQSNGSCVMIAQNGKAVVTDSLTCTVYEVRGIINAHIFSQILFLKKVNRFFFDLAGGFIYCFYFLWMPLFMLYTCTVYEVRDIYRIDELCGTFDSEGVAQAFCHRYSTSIQSLRDWYTI